MGTYPEQKPDRNLAILATLAQGNSYGQAAKLHDVSRNVVAGVADRAKRRKKATVQ